MTPRPTNTTRHDAPLTILASAKKTAIGRVVRLLRCLPMNSVLAREAAAKTELQGRNERLARVITGSDGA